jgi:hypothetical protein
VEASFRDHFDHMRDVYLSLPKEEQKVIVPPDVDENGHEKVLPRTASFGEFPMDNYCTVVTGYWPVKKYLFTPKYARQEYSAWLNNTLRINMPYLVFTGYDQFPLIQAIREGLPTMLIERNLSQFKAFKTYNQTWIDPYHLPSYELGLIWLEKMNLLHEAAKVVSSEYVIWIDAVIAYYRNRPVPPEPWSQKVFLSLPKYRVSYSIVHQSFHSVAATVLRMHRDLLPMIQKLFYEEYDLCRAQAASISATPRFVFEILPDGTRNFKMNMQNSSEVTMDDYERMVPALETDPWLCGSEQYLFTAVRNKYHWFFHIMSYEYGDISFLW